MIDLQETIQIKIKHIEELLFKLENKENITITAILQDELKNLKEMCLEYKKTTEDKKVIRKEESSGKTRYYLKDGSVYVTRGKEYRYLYDTKTKIVTYEFDNGQVERTFASGIKEIRKKDGSIIIKSNVNDYDHLC